MEVIACFNCSKLSINTISVSISLFIVLIIELLFSNNNLNIRLINVRENNNLISINEKISIEKQDKNEWKIEIPKINLKANIAEGTTKEILDFFVGHFEETPKDYGNVCLAAHNRGYNVNYFENIKYLELGDKIIYTYRNKQIIYEVEIIKIIEETDWSMLENTKENKITLITCLENQSEYRRCIQAIEMEEN